MTDATELLGGPADDHALRAVRLLRHTGTAITLMLRGLLDSLSEHGHAPPSVRKAVYDASWVSAAFHELADEIERS